MQSIFIVLLALLFSVAVIILVNFFLLKRKGETIKPHYLISIGALLIICSLLVMWFQSDWRKKYTNQVRRLNAEHQRKIEKLQKDYAKEIAFVEWKNKVFTSKSELEKDLVKAKETHQLTDDEVRMWRDLAENNTIEKLIPKDNTQEILKEYQERLKKSLEAIRSGHTLMNAEVRMLSDNISTIRLIGKEYEKVLSGFKELYANMIASNQAGTVMERPKQKRFLFFPIKQKEYEQLLEQYYAAQGNQVATAQIAEKLRVTIEQAEREFKAINRKFEENLSFLETNSGGISINSEKLENLIEAAISEVEIVAETNTKTSRRIKVKTPTKKN